jgi:hypothetical protein
MKQKLLFILGSYSVKKKNAVAATLAWAVEKSGRFLELYWDAYRAGRHYCGEPFRFKDGKIPFGDYFGSTVIGGMHHEQFYLLNNYFDTEFVLLNSPVLFESSVRAFEKPVISAGASYPDLYKAVFDHLGESIPGTATMLNAEPVYPMIFGFDALCYPDIYYSRTLGIDTSITIEELRGLKAMGISGINCVCVPREKRDELESLGFRITLADELEEGDGYGDLSQRICARWKSSAKQVSLTDAVLTAYWLPWLCRNKAVSLFDFDVAAIIPDLANIAHEKKQVCIWGRQNSDQDILKLSRENLPIQIIDPNRPVFPVMDRVAFPWVHTATSYSEAEPGDAELQEYAREGKVLATLLLHAGDVRHSDIIPRIFDFISVYKLKMGMGITGDWFNYVPELLELIQVPMESGGFFPYIEPLMYTGGLGIAAEGTGYMDLDVLRADLEAARALVGRNAGTHLVPRGYYTFLDINLRNFHKGRPELYKMIADMGFSYMVSSMNPGENEVQYRQGDFLSVNMSPPFFGFYSNFMRANDINEIDLCEDRCVEMKRPGWIIAALDSPVWGFESSVWEKGEDFRRIGEYMTSTGNTGKLMNVTPGVIARYARILADMGTVPVNKEY